MRRYYNNKNICFRLRVTRENHERMTKYIELTAKPIFPLKGDKHYSLRFEHKTFTCTFEKKKLQLSYKDIVKAETVADGIVIYLHDGTYIAVATEKSEKQNIELADTAILLKERCRFRFTETEPISYPDIEDCGRYKTNEEPMAQISFSLTELEIKRMLWYEHKGIFVFPVFLFVLSVVYFNPVILVVALLATVFTFVQCSSFSDEMKGFADNHRGRLTLLMYKDVFVFSLHNTDLELEYNDTVKKRSLFGLLRYKHGPFFTLTLPKKIEEENTDFFEKLNKTISKGL